jgi:hypothetical protein
MPHFLCTQDRCYGIQLHEGYKLVAGSQEGTTLQLPPEFGLQPEHYAVYHHAEGFWLENLVAQPTAVLVNGHPAAALALQSGDVIRAGCLTLMLEHVDVPEGTQIEPLAWPPPLPTAALRPVHTQHAVAIPPPRALPLSALEAAWVSHEAPPPAPAAPGGVQSRFSGAIPAPAAPQAAQSYGGIIPPPKPQTAYTARATSTHVPKPMPQAR